MKITLPNTGTHFSGHYAAVQWCHEHGVSSGSMCGAAPIALMRGDYLVAKWRNLSPQERRTAHGLMTSPNWRSGDVTIEMREEP